MSNSEKPLPFVFTNEFAELKAHMDEGRNIVFDLQAGVITPEEAERRHAAWVDKGRTLAIND